MLLIRNCLAGHFRNKCAFENVNDMWQMRVLLGQVMRSRHCHATFLSLWLVLHLHLKRDISLSVFKNTIRSITNNKSCFIVHKEKSLQITFEWTEFQWNLNIYSIYVEILNIYIVISCCLALCKDPFECIIWWRNEVHLTVSHSFLASLLRPVFSSCGDLL